MTDSRQQRRIAAPRVTSEILDRLPPSDTVAEMAVIGSALLSCTCLDEIGDLTREDFYDDANGRIFAAMVERYGKGKRVDIELLRADMQKSGDWEVVGGAAHVAACYQSVPNAAHARYYAEIVREKAILRRIIDAGTEAIRDAYGDSTEATDQLDRAESRLFSIRDGRSDNKITTYKDALEVAFANLEARAESGIDANTISSGFDNIDEHTLGLRKSELTILAARTSMGKTALALNIAHRVAFAGNVVLYATMEMAASELAERALSSESRLSSYRMRGGTLPVGDRLALQETIGKIATAKLHIDDAPAQRVSRIAAQARRVARTERQPIGLIVIDYLQLIEPDDDRVNRQEQVAKVTRRLKVMAKEFNVPMLVLAQLNRQTENSTDPRPKLHHLRESGAIEQDADNVWFIHRPEVYAKTESEKQEKKGLAELLIAKQRSGPRDVIAKLIFRGDCIRFDDAAPDRFNEFDQFNKNGYHGYS